MKFQFRPHRHLTYAWQVSKIVFLIVLTGVLLSLWGHARNVLESVRLASDEARAVLSEAQKAAFHVQAAAKAIKQEFGDPDAIKERNRVPKSTNALLATYTRSGEQLNTEILPEMTRTIAALQALTWETKAAIAVSGGHLSDILVQTKGAAEEFKLTAAGLHKIADETGAQIPQIAVAFKDLIASGQATTGQVNALLAHPDLPQLIVQAKRLLQESGDIAVNLDATTAEMSPIVKTARKWQTPVNIARLASVLIGLL